MAPPEREEFEWLGENPDNKVRAARLDEGLDVLTGLLSGEKFAYDGEQFRIRETVFLPGPVQGPCVPIWVAGVWPNKRPFRRAARWDGVFPVRWEGEITTEMMREIVSYTLRHRTSEEPLDVACAGRTPGGDGSGAAEIVASYAEAGVSWWVEDVAMWRFEAWEHGTSRTSGP